MTVYREADRVAELEDALQGQASELEFLQHELEQLEKRKNYTRKASEIFSFFVCVVLPSIAVVCLLTWCSTRSNLQVKMIVDPDGKLGAVVLCDGEIECRPAMAKACPNGYTLISEWHSSTEAIRASDRYTISCK